MLISKLSGFDPSNLAKLTVFERWKLEVFSIWAALGSLACAGAAAYLFHLSLDSIAIAIFVALTVGICFFAIQNVLNSNRILPLGISKIRSSLSSAKNFYIIIYLLLTFVFTQPILIYVSKIIDQNKITELNHLESQLRIQGLIDKHHTTQAKFQRELAKIREKINSLGVNLNNYVSEDELSFLSTTNPSSNSVNQVGLLNLASAARKALMIGNNGYVTDPLNGAIADAKAMKGKLEKMGFSVTLLTDANRLTLEKAIVTYVNTLNPGDLSFIYYSGHGTQVNGVNYLIPTDAEGLSDFVSINKLMQMQKDKSVLAEIIMTDACRYSGNYETGFDSRGASRNTYIALAAAAGEYSYDGVPNGVFTTRVLKHISEEKDIDKIFNIIKQEMANDPQVKQHPTSINLLDEPLMLAIPKESTRPLPAVAPTQLNNNLKSKPLQCSKIEVTSLSETDRNDFITLCISEFLKIKDDLIADQNKLEKDKISLEELLAIRFSDDQFNPVYFYNYLWSTQTLNFQESNSINIKPIYQSTVLTFLIWILLAGGFIGRENQIHGLSAYRSFRVEQENEKLKSIYLEYINMADQAMNSFKRKISKIISSNGLIDSEITPNLSDPFADDEDIANREKSKNDANHDAIDHLKKFLNSP